MANDAPATGSEVDYHDLLVHEQVDLQRQLAELGFGESGGLKYDSNFADSSQVTAERGEAEALAGELRDALQEVEAALNRLADGSYGQCQSCGQPIAPARLEAIPTTRHCINCASRK